MVMLPIYYAVSFHFILRVFFLFSFNLAKYEAFTWFKSQNCTKKRYTQKRLPSVFFVSFFSFLQKLANSYNVYTWIHPLQMVYVMYSLLYLSFLLNSMSWRSLLFDIVLRILQRIGSCLWRLTSAKICRMSWHARDPGEPNQWYHSNSKASRLETQEELLFQFESEGRKNSVFQPKGSLAGSSSCSGEGQCFSFMQTFTWLDAANLMKKKSVFSLPT